MTLHVWASRVPGLWHPDVCILDLGPSIEDAGQLRGAICAVRDLLAELGVQELGEDLLVATWLGYSIGGRIVG